MASSAAAASAGSSMIAKYISKVRAGLRRQRPEAREAWLEAEMDSMQIGSSHQGKPSLRDVCRYLNLAVSEKQKWLNKQTLVKNLVEKLMSEAAHVVESASLTQCRWPTASDRQEQGYCDLLLHGRCLFHSGWRVCGRC